MKTLDSAGVEEFHRMGLLYLVNRDVLWPLGFALTITATRGPDGELTDYLPFLTIQATDPPEVIADPDPVLDVHVDFAVAARKRSILP